MINPVKIQLLYFPGCPNVEETREVIKKALKSLSLDRLLVEEVDMRRMMPVAIAAVMLLLLLVSPVLAAVPEAQQSQQDQARQQVPELYEETIVVSASRFEQLLFDVPVSITVISGVLLENSPGAGNLADLLRIVPGLNVSQTSARDINITARGATNTLATTQLVLVDGRAVYQDFFGFVQRHAELWKLGTKGKDNGILIAFRSKSATEKGDVRIHPGYGLEALMPDSWCGS
ncbi:MAG: TonB-dependent receptor plug domain-containing protein, partial [Proteobacteria bacterium]|nr:TonB-dependent receptor plug domain-containing protein [Pseudomonadota bacterium]